LAILEFAFPDSAQDIHTTRFRWPFLVCPDLIRDVFIGTDFLTRFSATLEFATLSMHLRLPRKANSLEIQVAASAVHLSKDERAFLAPFARPEGQVVPLRSEYARVLQPWSQTALPAIAPKLISAYGRDAIMWVTSAGRALYEYGVLTAQGYTATLEGRTMAVVCNLSDDTILIPAGGVIGAMVPVDKQRMMQQQVDRGEREKIDDILQSLPEDQQAYFDGIDLASKTWQQAVEWVASHGQFMAAAIRAFHKDYGKGPTQQEALKLLERVDVPEEVVGLLKAAKHHCCLRGPSCQGRGWRGGRRTRQR
jgi:hypothetical protein